MVDETAGGALLPITFGQLCTSSMRATARADTARDAVSSRSLTSCRRPAVPFGGNSIPRDIRGIDPGDPRLASVELGVSDGAPEPRRKREGAPHIRRIRSRLEVKIGPRWQLEVACNLIPPCRPCLPMREASPKDRDAVTNKAITVKRGTAQFEVENRCWGLSSPLNGRQAAPMRSSAA